MEGRGEERKGRKEIMEIKLGKVRLDKKKLFSLFLVWIFVGRWRFFENDMFYMKNNAKIVKNSFLNKKKEENEDEKLKKSKILFCDVMSGE